MATFTNHRFVQVFYPTRGTLVWYNRATGEKQPLPGADDPHYVHTNAVWSPDGAYLVFSRAEAKTAFPQTTRRPSSPMILTNCPSNTTSIGFRSTRARAAEPEPIAGTSQNGMSNTFPKVSPDGRWIVFVQCHNGQLMRPDSQLYMSRRKAASAADAMQHHADELLAQLFPEWPLVGLFFEEPDVLHANVPYAPGRRWQRQSGHPDRQCHGSQPGSEHPRVREHSYGWFAEDRNAGDQALSSLRPRHGTDKERQDESALASFQKALDMDPEYPPAHAGMGISLLHLGRRSEAILQLQRAIQLKPDYAEAYGNLGVALFGDNKPAEAMAQFRRAVELKPDYAEAYYNLGIALVGTGRLQEAVANFQQAVKWNPAYAEAHYNLGTALADLGNTQEAIPHFERALQLDPKDAHAHNNLGCALATTGKLPEAVAHFERQIELQPDYAKARNNLNRPFRPGPHRHPIRRSSRTESDLRPINRKIKRSTGQPQSPTCFTP